MGSVATTYEKVSHLIAHYVQNVEPGQFALPINLYDEDGRPLSSTDDFLGGAYLILLFLNAQCNDEARKELGAYVRCEAALRDLNARLLVISASSNADENKNLKTEIGLQCPILGDPAGACHATFGVHMRSASPVLRTVVLTPMGQVRAIFDVPEVGGHAMKVTDILENAAVATEVQWRPPHAPTLMIPKVLTPDECASLIKSVEADCSIAVDQNDYKAASGNVTVPLYEYDRQDRMNLFIRSQQTLSFLDQRLAERVNPMIKKAFSFDVSKREEIHVARYEGERGGMKMGHRDNITQQTAHRRFALSLSLSDEYEGGEILFREFSEKGYRLSVGSALIFSSSLLHEVSETTSGVRYVLITHLY